MKPVHGGIGVRRLSNDNWKIFEIQLDKSEGIYYTDEAVRNDMASRYGSMVEQLICNQQVDGSSPPIGSIEKSLIFSANC